MAQVGVCTPSLSVTFELLPLASQRPVNEPRWRSEVVDCMGWTCLTHAGSGLCGCGGLTCIVCGASGGNLLENGPVVVPSIPA